MDHNVLGGFTVLLPCDFSSGLFCSVNRLMRAGFSHPLKSPTMSLESLAAQNIPSCQLLQPRAGQEPARAQTSMGQTSFPPEMS